MNVLLLGAAQSTPRTEHNKFPPWLAEHKGSSPIEDLTKSFLSGAKSNLIYCFLESDIREFHLREVLHVMAPEHVLISVKHVTEGAACTALLASDIVDCEDELLIVSLNEYLEVDLVKAAAEFRDRDLDAATLVFESVHPRYSFVKLGPDNLVMEAAQGRPITNIATSGAFWFRRGSDFVAGCKQMIRKRDNVNGSYFVCPVFNQLILMNRRIGVTWMAPNIYHPLKTEAQIHAFEFDL